MPERVLVTGGTGFIGYNLVKHLKKAGDSVVVLARREMPDYLEGLVDRYHQGDVTIRSDVDDAISGVNVVYHLANQVINRYTSFSEMVRVSGEGMGNVLLASLASDVRRVVAVSTMKTCGFSKDGLPVDEESSIYPDFIMPTLNSRLELEATARMYENKIEIAVARLARVYGAGDYLGRNTLAMGQLRNPVVFVPPGKTSVVSVDDCVEALHLLSNHYIPPGKYVISAESMPLRDIYTMFKEETGSKTTLINLPHVTGWLLRNFVLPLMKNRNKSLYEMIMSGISDKIVESKKLRAVGWKPKKRMGQAIHEQTAFYKRHSLI